MCVCVLCGARAGPSTDSETPATRVCQCLGSTSRTGHRLPGNDTGEHRARLSLRTCASAFTRGGHSHGIQRVASSSHCNPYNGTGRTHSRGTPPGPRHRDEGLLPGGAATTHSNHSGDHMRRRCRHPVPTDVKGIGCTNHASVSGAPSIAMVASDSGARVIPVNSFPPLPTSRCYK